jgi:hypothetical protein
MNFIKAITRGVYGAYKQNQFLLGALTSIVGVGSLWILISDIMGMQRYVDFVIKYWVTPWIGVPFAIFGLIEAVVIIYIVYLIKKEEESGKTD